jgi:hypothetical protein
METNLAEPDMFRYRFRPHSRRNPQTAARQYRAPSPSHTGEKRSRIIDDRASSDEFGTVSGNARCAPLHAVILLAGF